uniref:Probable DNA polymerase n=1 Tax=Russula abietina TaxID=482377 RepID=A0A2S0U3N8_9AGAM|nr:hypothetical protein [Russula abietina]AWB36108.1 hypothetical protein [Russula abietina]
MIKYQNFSHYKLPITMDPLKYGKLLDETNQKFIIQLTTKNIAVIKQYPKENFVRIFKNGELVLEFRDKFLSENLFKRSIYDTIFTFENEKLIKTEISNLSGLIEIFSITPDNLTPFNMQERNLKNNKTKNYLFPKWLEDSKYAAELFILFELFLIFLVYIVFFVLFSENSNIAISIAILSSKNISSFRRGKRKVWTEREFKINKKIFEKTLFNNKFDEFWSEIENNFTEKNHIYIIFKINYQGAGYSSIGQLQRLTKHDKNWYLNWILNNLVIKAEYYNESPIESFIFSYGFLNKPIKKKIDFVENLYFQDYSNKIKLPVSLLPSDYGIILFQNELEDHILFIIEGRDGFNYQIKKFNETNEIKVTKLGSTIVEFTDKIISKNLFSRTIGNKIFYFENNKEILFTKEIKCKFISKLKKSKNLTENFLTLDIETFKKSNGELVPFLISIYDGNKTNSFYLPDFKNVEYLVLTAINSIMIKKYNNWNIYIHNMAKFDMIFLLKYLVKLGHTQPIIHNNRIISVELITNKINLKFKDSYLILLASLNKLSKAFKIKNPKSQFPIFFLTENNLEYEGIVPDIKFFKNITFEEYNKYKNSFNNLWNLKKESIKYCEIDCISLHQVISNFSILIYDLFQKDMHKYATLPSLAFAIYRTKFMKEENIPQITGKIEENIRSGYTGGAVDMYIPESKPNKKIFCYDVNSLYPSVMESQDMPIGNPVYFKGDITKIYKNSFGFFYCKITSPENINHPIIQKRHKINGLTSTISPIGSWEGMIFSEEMKNAMKFGYKFEILWGYTFLKENIFKEYVNFLYNMRLQYDKSNPLNFIAKILMNSLYGRFGMSDNFDTIKIISKKESNNYEFKILDSLIEKIDLGTHVLFRSKTEENQDDTSEHNISVGIAAAITAYARVHMSLFKNNPEINLFYTDTDSIYTDSVIPDYFIDNKILGKLKLENICEKAIFLAPKLYCLTLENGETVYKTKGLKHEIILTINDFNQLLYKDKILQKNQEKWYKNLTESKITIVDQIYTMKVTQNKRQLIYDNYGKIIETKAYKIINPVFYKRIKVKWF